MKRKFRILYILVLVTSVALVSAACGPTPTEAPPTSPPTEEPPVITQTPAEELSEIDTDDEDAECLKWDQISIDMAGEEVCVYGTAFSHQGQSRIDFSPEKNSFFLIDATYYYENLSEGVCVAAIETVEVFDKTIPFMTLRGDLFECEPWMEE